MMGKGANNETSTRRRACARERVVNLIFLESVKREAPKIVQGQAAAISSDIAHVCAREGRGCHG